MPPTLQQKHQAEMAALKARHKEEISLLRAAQAREKESVSLRDLYQTIQRFSEIEDERGRDSDWVGTAQELHTHLKFYCELEGFPQDAKRLSAENFKNMLDELTQRGFPFIKKEMGAFGKKLFRIII